MEEVKNFSHAIRSILRYLEVNSGNMEKGVMRFEANVSVRPVGSDQFGTRTEIKNLNSFRAMVRALNFEVDRQSKIHARGGEVVQETLGWDKVNNVTVSQRGKEEAHDYRYFPEPDLPPLHVDATWIEQIQSQLPELPDAKAARFVEEYKITPYTAKVLVVERSVADFFEETTSIAANVPAEKIANWITSDLFGLLNEAGIELSESKISSRSLAEIVNMVENGDINTTSAKVVLEETFQSGDSPKKIVEAKGLSQLNDAEAIDSLVEKVLRENPEEVEQYLGGKQNLSQWFFGQVMQETRGRANPSVVRSSLEKSLQQLEDSRDSDTV
jgi:aspartyl-tRNA(Asn)/glutamyl-tRNA(Gln) amidotransferase subunit B